MNSIEDLIAVLTLEKKSKKKYIGVSKTIGSPNVFGGQVLAKALSAANNSVYDHRVLHSLHAYYLEAGNLELPIIYSV